METPQPVVTFVVRLHRQPGAGWIGVIERVATGEKRRCRGLHDIAVQIDEMTRAASDDGAPTRTRNDPAEEEDSHHDDVDA